MYDIAPLFTEGTQSKKKMDGCCVVVVVVVNDMTDNDVAVIKRSYL